AGRRLDRLGVGDRRVAGEDDMEGASGLLQADGHGDDVEQLQAEVGVVLEGIGVERRADGHGLVGMDTLGGRLPEAVAEPLLHERSILTRSARSLIRCIATGSVARSMWCFFWKSSMTCRIIAWSKSNPPRKMSPPVAFTSKTRSRISMIDTSKVPPPRS